MRITRRTGLIALIALAAVAVAGTAYATIPDSSGVIHGCYDSGGNLKVIDAPTTPSCPKGYTPVNWNNTGSPGPQGPKGDKGDPGTFAGHFASPNGKFAIDVTDDGIVLQGPSNSVAIDGTSVTVKGYEDHWDKERHLGTEDHYGNEDHRGFLVKYDGTSEEHNTFETHSWTETHSGRETHSGYEEHHGEETHSGYEAHHGDEDHSVDRSNGQIVFGAETFFTANCSDAPRQFFKVDVGLSALGTPFFAPGVSACK